ncbi:hypothetical protein EC2866550_3599 [Escherichia coli 2866550]|nr:hypothetical protein EC2866550_3599 [Escherichia coli 2866550]
MKNGARALSDWNAAQTLFAQRLMEAYTEILELDSCFKD